MNGRGWGELTYSYLLQSLVQHVIVSFTAYTTFLYSFKSAGDKEGAGGLTGVGDEGVGERWVLEVVGVGEG